MPPPHGSGVLPGARLTTTGGGMPGRATGWITPGRAGRALVAALALAAAGMPAALLACQSPAAAATGEQVAQSRVSVAITGMTPRQASPGATITVTGTITNTSPQPITNLSVRLLGSSTPVSTPAELEPGSTGQDALASTPLRHGTWKPAGALQPRATARWSVQVKASSIGMTTFGVYPLTAQAQASQAGSAQTAPGRLTLAAATTFLPYVPARKGPYGKSIPAQAKISWVLPLIDKPLLGQPWQNPCQGAQARALVASLGSGGRLGRLVAAAGDSMAVRSAPAQSLSRYDRVTWAIDPALLANVRSIAGCGAAQPRWARAARDWLASLRQVTSAEPVFFTPYADPDVAALVAKRGQAPDVGLAFQLGQQIGQQILHPSLGSSAPGIAWPAGGIAGYSTVEYLVGQVGVRTLLLGNSAMPGEQPTVVRVLNSVGGYMNVLLANESLTQVLAAGDRTAGSAFATAQDFLAQTALAAQQDPGAPLIVAPPRRFDPAPGLTADLLAETASAPWLSPASLTSLTTGKHIPDAPNSAWAGSQSRISKRLLRRLRLVDGEIALLKSIAANPDDKLSLAIATVESSAWQGKSRATALGLLATVKRRIARQEQDVQIFAEPRVTLGGLKGSVPVSIDNRLGFAVRVRLRLHYSHATGLKINAEPGGLVTVPAHTAMTVRLHVQATEVGSSSVTMNLQNRSYQLLPAPSQSMTVQATQVGVLGVIICAAALGIFLIAYAARAVRHGRPADGTDQPPGPGSGTDQGGDRSTMPAEPDTVMAERTELGTAGAPGP